ncbi:MAG TPA: prolipoprotein diacylglyceryl transferase [Clostridia bacterium]|nr:prolipoprotein diacylglyceryl transferase [Clostridia bacterium]
MVNPDRVAFTVFGKEIYWYGILMATGIIIAVWLAMREAKRKEMQEDTILDLCLVIIPCGIIGARLYYVLFELKQYLANPIRILYLWEGGLAFYGAVIGGMLGLVVYAKRKKLSIIKLSDVIAPGLALAQAIGRWGNFFNQEAFGLPVTNPKLLWFPMSVKIDVPWNGGFHTFNGMPCSNPYHLATFFYESVWCALIFIFLWFYLRKRAKHDGDVFLYYAVLYSFERMFIEGLRGDSLWLIEGTVRVSQLLSALMFAGLVVFILIRAAKEKKLGYAVWPSSAMHQEITEPDASVMEPSCENYASEKQDQNTTPDSLPCALEDSSKTSVSEDANVEEDAIKTQ